MYIYIYVYYMYIYIYTYLIYTHTHMGAAGFLGPRNFVKVHEGPLVSGRFFFLGGRGQVLNTTNPDMNRLHL